MAFIAMITGCNKESDMGPVAGDGLIIDHSCAKLSLDTFGVDRGSKG